MTANDGARGKDPVSPELRLAERQIDEFVLSNPLMKLPFGTAAWYFMAFYEDLAVMRILKGPTGSPHEDAAFSDYLVNKLQYPLNWFRVKCPPGGRVPLAFDDDQYQASSDLDELANNYEPFVSAFTYASRGVVELQLDGNVIRLSKPFYEDSRYDAYDRLAMREPPRPDLSQGNIVQLVDDALTVSGDKFQYQLGRKLVAQCARILRPVITPLFDLPDHWSFPGYTLKEFRAAAVIFVTLSHIHFVAHLRAAQRGCLGGGYLSSILVLPRDRVEWLLLKNAGIPQSVCQAILRDLTYGSRGMRHPDPALQPIIAINEEVCAIMPSLFISSSMERNLVTLLNRLPAERAAYLSLVGEKEGHMRRQIQTELVVPGLRFFQGPFPGRDELPDLDLVLISDSDRLVIVAELKWFVAPAEPREVLEKTREIRSGIAQVLSLASAIEKSSTALHQGMAIDATYEFAYCVISENSIGDEGSQHEKVPVVNRAHFVRKLNELASLRALNRWLVQRDYLPIRGEDYRLLEPTYTIGKWHLNWYAIEPILAEAYRR